MKKENGLSQLNENLKQHRSFTLFWLNEPFADFKYDVELKRYQSKIGWLSIEDVYEFGQGKDKYRTIKWI